MQSLFPSSTPSIRSISHGTPGKAEILLPSLFTQLTVAGQQRPRSGSCEAESETVRQRKRPSPPVRRPSGSVKPGRDHPAWFSSSCRYSKSGTATETGLRQRPAFEIAQERRGRSRIAKLENMHLFSMIMKVNAAALQGRDQRFRDKTPFLTRQRSRVFPETRASYRRSERPRLHGSSLARQAMGAAANDRTTVVAACLAQPSAIREPHPNDSCLVGFASTRRNRLAH